MERAIAFIRRMGADYGGTQPLGAIQASHAILKADAFGKCKNIFLLTDGSVSYGPECQREGEINRDSAAVHTIAIGSGADRNFCKGMAEKAGGYCTIVTESEMAEDKMSGLIINSLDMASQIGV